MDLANSAAGLSNYYTLRTKFGRNVTSPASTADYSISFDIGISPSTWVFAYIKSVRVAAVTTPGTAGPSNVYVTLAYLIS